MSDIPPEYPAHDPGLDSPASAPSNPGGSFIKPDRPRIWTVLVFFVVSFLGAVVAGVAVLTVVTVVQHGPEGLNDADLLLEVGVSPPGFILSMLAMELVLLLAALIAASCSQVPVTRRLRLGASGVSPLGYAVMAVGMLALSFALDSLIVLSEMDPGPALKAAGDAIRNCTAHPSALVALLLVVGIGPAFGEEFVCRGYIQTRLSRRWGAGWAIVVSSVLFGLLHVDPVHATLAFVMGLYLGYIAERTGSIRPAIFCHAVNNMSHVALSASLPEGLPRSSYVLLLVASLILLGVSLWLLPAGRVRRHLE